MEGYVFNIQRFCVQDGPGIRTTVFLKGCPLRCAWCHNPESHHRKPEILFDPSKCIMCGACAAACERHTFADGKHLFNRDGCAGCGRCAENCYADALELCGKTMTAEEVIDTVARDKAFYRDGGGMTLSGGEPLMQPEFSAELARLAKEKDIHVAMETCGECAPDTLKEVAQHVDLFLFDIKAMDAQIHKQYTGVSNERILKNLETLNGMGKAIILRCPIIPGVNLTEEHFAAVADLAEKLENVLEVQLEPYHPLGVQKSEKLGRTAAYAEKEFLQRSEVEKFASQAQPRTKKKLVIQ